MTERDPSPDPIRVLLYLPASSGFFQTFPMEDAIRRIQDVDGVEVHVARDPASRSALLPRANVYFGTSLPGTEVERATELRWIQVAAAGVDRILSEEIRLRPVVVTNARGVMAAAVADHTFALILAMSRGIDLSARDQAAKEWGNRVSSRPLWELEGRTIGIVGYGRIGEEIGRRALGFGMRVWGTKRNPELGGAHADRLLAPDDVGELLAHSDIVVLVLPGTPETRHSFGEKSFRLMQRHALLVSVGRGEVVDEDALLKALEHGWIGGACLDVFAEEPLPPESPLWKAPRTLITPHTAGQTPHYWERTVSLFVENLHRFQQGTPLTNVVNTERGY